MAHRTNINGYSGYSEDERGSRSPDDLNRDRSIDNGGGDKPTYLLEHLATFTVNKESGIVFPADGMRRLLQLEKTTGIWSQKMQLCLDRQWVLIMDYETGNIIERFPASLIQEPTAFTSNSPMEMYNNILVIIVAGTDGSRSEMHIFQCQSISAVHLVEDLKQLRSGKHITHHRQTVQSAQKSRDYHQHSYNHYQQQETDSEIDGCNDDQSSTTSEKYERDVMVLNHCFDDIEKFIARLQHAAAAARELERRRRARKSKKKDPGEGMLTLRTRPPHEREFVDIFAKFKLSFNLLAKLKAHIHDPNAPELVHFLFTPLALIVDASHDTYYDPHIPARVVNPLMTREAINLLTNCVTSKETELWRSLGDAWTLTREQWKGSHVASYHPVFFDGWSPDYSVIDELDNTSATPTNSRRRIGQPRHFTNTNTMAASIGDYDFDISEKYNNQPSSSPVALNDFRSELSVDSIERIGGASNSISGVLVTPQVETAALIKAPMASNSGLKTTVGNTNEWIEEVIARGGKIAQVTYPRTANNDKELTVSRGEYLEILDDSRKWWKAKNNQNHIGHVPHTIITPYNYADNALDAFNNGPISTLDHFGNFSHHSNQSSRESTSSPPAAAVMPTITTASADWVRSKHTDWQVQPHHDERFNEPLSSFTNNNNQTNNIKTNTMKHYDQHSANHTNLIRRASVGVATNISAPLTVKSTTSLPPVPPPPPPPSYSQPVTPIPTRPTSRTNTISRKSVVSTTSAGPDEMQEELKHVLTLFRQKRAPSLDIIKTPDCFIQQTATPKEVENWLKVKGFSEKVCKQLHGINGNDLFALKRAALEEVFGTDEGKRLASQITIQRNISGYKTARSSELQAILARARKKTEEEV